jgi:hypothetical protein
MEDGERKIEASTVAKRRKPNGFNSQTGDQQWPPAFSFVMAAKKRNTHKKLLMEFSFVSFAPLYC